jgi:hypothetical protein
MHICIKKKSSAEIRGRQQRSFKIKHKVNSKWEFNTRGRATSKKFPKSRGTERAFA